MNDGIYRRLQAKEAYSTFEEIAYVVICFVRGIGRCRQALVQPRIGMNVEQKRVIKMQGDGIVAEQGARNYVANTNS